MEIIQSGNAMCQFLIGNVKHGLAMVFKENEECQFLIGNVKHAIVYFENPHKGMCQFLIGNVKHLEGNEKRVVVYWIDYPMNVSIPHR